MADNTTVISSTGGELHIVASSTLPATYDTTGYDALTYVEVEEVASIGDFNNEAANVNTFTDLKTGTINKRKGSSDYGSINVSMATARGNTGQGHIFTAGAASGPSSFKIVDSNGNINYIEALVTTITEQIGGPDDNVLTQFTLELTRKPVYKAAP